MMRSSTAGWTQRERALLALCVASLGLSIAAYLDLGGSAGAAPGAGVGSSVSSAEIRNSTIRPADVRRVGAEDLRTYTRFGPVVGINPGGATRRVDAACAPDDKAISEAFESEPRISGQPGPLLYSSELGAFAEGGRNSNNWTYGVYNPAQVIQYFRPGVVCLS